MGCKLPEVEKCQANNVALNVNVLMFAVSYESSSVSVNNKDGGGASTVITQPPSFHLPSRGGMNN